MAPTVNIGSSAEFSKLLSSSNVVITDFYADWCGPCKQIAPLYENLSTKHSKPNSVTFTKVNVDSQQAIAQKYGVRAMPTFLIFRSGSVIDTIQGADPRRLTSAIESAIKLAGPAKPTYSSVGHTLGSSASAGGRSGNRVSVSNSRPFDLKAFGAALVAFFGLYFVSLFALDAYTAAENSPFNVNRPAVAAGGNADRRTGAATTVGKRLGTIADISGN